MTSTMESATEAGEQEFANYDMVAQAVSNLIGGALNDALGKLLSPAALLPSVTETMAVRGEAAPSTEAVSAAIQDFQKNVRGVELGLSWKNVTGRPARSSLLPLGVTPPASNGTEATPEGGIGLSIPILGSLAIEW